jgi:DNA invertase Pin-like site-specific DNA recombinase
MKGTMKKTPAGRKAARSRTLSLDLVALYMRVSGDRQEREATIETQEQYLREYCRVHQLTVVRVYKDQAIQNETPFDDRPEGHRLFEDAASDRFGRVLIYHSTRWSWNHIVFGAEWDRLTALGVKLESITEILSDETLEQEYGTDIQLRSNKLFHDFINRNFIRGRYRRASQGGFPGGWMAYGWDKAPDPAHGEKRWKHVPFEPEAEIVRWIFHLCVVEQLSCPQIARRLTEAGIPTAAFSEKESAARHAQTARRGRRAASNHWHRSFVNKILKNRAYLGEASYGGGYEAAVNWPRPPLIEGELFAAAQLQLERNSRLAARNTLLAGENAHVYLLKGKLRCPVHGCCYSGYRHADGPNARYRHQTPCFRYRCNRWSDRSKTTVSEPARCPFPNIDAARWEADVWEKLVAHLLDQPGTVARLQSQLAGEETEEGRLLRQRDRLLREREELDEEYRLALRGRNRIGLDLTGTQAAAVIADVERERNALDEPLAAVAASLSLARDQAGRLQAAGSMIRRYASRLQGPLSARDKQQIIDTFLVEARPEIDRDGQGRMVYVFCFDDTAESAIAATGTGSLLLQLHSPLDRWPRAA